MSIVEKNEPVMLAQCPLCQGATLYVIERFVTLEDRRDFSEQEKMGYSITRMPLDKAGNLGECRCTEAALNRYRQKSKTEGDRPKKSVLSLSVRQ